MRYKDARNISEWRKAGQQHEFDVVGNAPVHTIQVGDSIVHNTTDNIRKVVDIVPDAKLPDAYVKFHFEDGGAMTLPTKSTVMVPSTYKIGVEYNHREPGTGWNVRSTDHGRGPHDKVPFNIKESPSRMDQEGVVFHGMTFEEANPWLRGRQGHFNHGGTEHL